MYLFGWYVSAWVYEASRTQDETPWHCSFFLLPNSQHIWYIFHHTIWSMFQRIVKKIFISHIFKGHAIKYATTNRFNWWRWVQQADVDDVVLGLTRRVVQSHNHSGGNIFSQSTSFVEGWILNKEFSFLSVFICVEKTPVNFAWLET